VRLLLLLCACCLFCEMGDAGKDGTYPQISLSVYDLTGVGGLINPITELAGIGGAYHVGVHIDGAREWSYGWRETGTGVYVVDPGTHWVGELRHSVPLGRSKSSWAEIRTIIARSWAVWDGPAYNVFSQNCIHFSQELVALLGLRCPFWVSSLVLASDFLTSAASLPVNAVKDAATVVVDLVSSPRQKSREEFRDPPEAIASLPKEEAIASLPKEEATRPVYIEILIEDYEPGDESRDHGNMNAAWRADSADHTAFETNRCSKAKAAWCGGCLNGLFRARCESSGRHTQLKTSLNLRWSRNLNLGTI